MIAPMKGSIMADSIPVTAPIIVIRLLGLNANQSGSSLSARVIRDAERNKLDTRIGPFANFTFNLKE